MDKFFTLRLRDFIKGIVVAVFGAGLGLLQSLAVSPDFSFAEVNWQRVLIVSLTAGLSYIVTNLLSWETPTTEHIAGIKLDK